MGLGRRYWGWIAVLLLAAALVGCSGSGERLSGEELRRAVDKLAAECGSGPGVAEVTAAEAARLDAEGRAVFVDARPEAERAVSALPGAVAPRELYADPARFAGRTVVAYCTVGCRSAAMAREAAARGIAVLNLRGGILAWVAEGRPVYASGVETRRVHVYGRKWNVLPPGYDAVY